MIKAPRAQRPAAVLAAASETAAAFARAQCLVGEGPGIDAAAVGGMVTSNDLASELRWPALRELRRQHVSRFAAMRVSGSPRNRADSR